jgi:Polyketide cyclase / dehydrase and lipid transport
MIGSIPAGTPQRRFPAKESPCRRATRTLKGMPRLSKQIIVAAPAHAVWQVIGPGFDRIGDWATAIPAVTALPVSGAGRPSPALVGAPVAGRVCATGLRLVPQVTETLVAYDDVDRTLTYEATGMPSFVTTARNTWTVTPLDERHCRVTIDARFDTRGLIGGLARRLLLLQVGRTSRHLADDLRHYVEHGTPSPRKQRQLARVRRP